MSEAKQILDNLGMTATEVEGAASRVEAVIDLKDRERELEPSITLEDGTTVSRFQMVRESISNPLIDDSDDDVVWVVTAINSDEGTFTCKVPTDWSKCTISVNEMQSSAYEPLTTDDGEVMWGY